jgi:hypothetical protein
MNFSLSEFQDQADNCNKTMKMPKPLHSKALQATSQREATCKILTDTKVTRISNVSLYDHPDHGTHL